MPRTYPPRRTLTAIRLAPDGLAEIDTLAKAEGVNRSAMMRTLIGEALAARPKRKDAARLKPGGDGRDGRRVEGAG